MNLLERMLESKRKEVAVCKERAPVRTLLRGRTAESKDFAASLQRRGISVIAEIKRKSPSTGMFLEECDAAEIAGMYEEHGAAAVSVLTDREFFGGSLEDLQRVKAHCRIPVLRKDFIIDEYQLYESARYGADAVLLIAGALSLEMLREFRQLAESLGLSCLIEAHSAREVSKAVSSGGTIIGINNRDLETLSVDIGISLKLREAIPEGCISVSESGIRTRDDVERLFKADYDGVLVGMALMESLGRRDLLGELIEVGYG